MNKLLLLLFMFPIMGIGQHITFNSHYDAEHAAQHIIKGQVSLYLQDTVKFTIERKREKYITDYNMLSKNVKIKLQDVFSKGKPEFSGRTNGGYVFTIIVMDRNNELKILNFVTFYINEWTQKIEEIEVLLGE